MVAVSGGADSMALLELLATTERRPLIAWHLDHGLRPDAPADAALVARRVGQLRRRGSRIALTSERCDVAAIACERGVGLEQAGRDERYARLTAIARACGAAAVCTAHHRDDLVETALMNLLRGCDLTGLAAIPERRELAPGIALVRPLLRIDPARLRGLLRRRGLAWNEDASNRDLRFTRNRVRRLLLPELRSAGLDQALAARCFAAQARWRTLDAAVDKAWRRDGDALVLAPLMALDAAARGHAWRRLVRELALPATRAAIARIQDLAHGVSGRRLRLGPLTLWRACERVRWERDGASEPAPVLRVDACEPTLGDDHSPVLDADAVRGELTLRNAEAGERWTALGAPGSRPVLRWLADRGVPAGARRRLWLAADDEGVVWVPGYGIADRVRVHGSTRRAITLAMEPAEHHNVPSDRDVPGRAEL